MRTQATVEWSAEEPGFEFHSDAAATSTTNYAEVAEERNGFFFSWGIAASEREWPKDSVFRFFLPTPLNGLDGLRGE